MWRNVAVYLGCILVVQAGQLPGTIPRCYRHDPFLDQCLTQAVQLAIPQLSRGISELGFPPIDPLTIGDFDIPPFEDNTLGIYLRNATGYGLSQAQVVGVRSDLDNARIEIYAYVPEFRVQAEYRLDGDALGQSLKSEGLCNITLSFPQASVSPTGNMFRRKGRQYFNVDRGYLVFKSVSQVHFNFDGLDPDPKKNAALNENLNKNSVSLFEAIKPQWEQFFSLKARDAARPIFNNVSMEDIFLENPLLHLYQPVRSTLWK